MPSFRRLPPRLRQRPREPDMPPCRLPRRHFIVFIAAMSALPARPPFSFQSVLFHYARSSHAVAAKQRCHLR